jgi:hypothetical protein
LGAYGQAGLYQIIRTCHDQGPGSPPAVPGERDPDLARR